MRGGAPTHEGNAPAGSRRMGLLLLLIASAFVAWSLRVAFVNFDALAGLLDEALRAAIRAGSVLL